MKKFAWSQDDVGEPSKEEYDTAERISAEIGQKYLAGVSPVLAGWMLANLAATYLAGYHPESRFHIKNSFFTVINNLTDLVTEDEDPTRWDKSTYDAKRWSQ